MFFVRAIEFHSGIVASPSCTFNYKGALIALCRYQAADSVRYLSINNACLLMQQLEKIFFCKITTRQPLPATPKLYQTL